MLLQEQRQNIILEIERVRGEVVEGVLEDMYQNPFWEARFGERGRVHTRQDTHYHLNYLVAAVDLNNPATLSTYFHWCQGMFVYHGMCALHLQQTLDSLGDQLARRLPAAWPAIEPIYRASYQGLFYERPDCRALAERQAEIADKTTARMFPPRAAGIEERRKQACYQDNLYHLSYLTGAVDYQTARSFTQYADWLKSYFPTLHVPVSELSADFRALAAEIEQALGAEQAGPFVELLLQ